MPQTDDYKLELDESERVIKRNQKPQENKRCLKVIQAEPLGRRVESAWERTVESHWMSRSLTLKERRRKANFSSCMGMPSLNQIIITVYWSER